MVFLSVGLLYTSVSEICCKINGQREQSWWWSSSLIFWTIESCCRKSSEKGPCTRRVSLSVSDCCLTITQQFSSLYHGENKLIFNKMKRSNLYSINMIGWIFMVLANWNNFLKIDMSPHSHTLSWFWANTSLLSLLNAACLAEKQQMPFFGLWFDPIGAQTDNLPHSKWAS